MTESLETAESVAPAAASEDALEPPVQGEADFPFAQHVELRTVVLRELRVLYLPIPKAGWTTVLWLLSELAGIPAETFEHSTLPGVSPALTVHDMSLWGPGRRLADYEGEERERVLTEDGWLRFSVVRDPAPRLWSAWQSKLLLREPRFFTEYGEEPWFPRVPHSPDDAVEDFRRFVAAVAAGEAVDVHWAVQHDLVARLPLGHVGRLEALDETLALLKAHVPEELWPTETRHENRTPLPLPRSAFDAATAEGLNRHYAADFDEYGYEPVRPSGGKDDLADWREQVTPLVPLVQETIDRHTRIGQLHRMARRVHTVEGWLEQGAARRVGHSRSPVLTNLEHQADFNVRWGWAEGTPAPGFTAVVRAKNEERALPWVLPPLLRAAERVVLIDNGSTDRTLEVARATAADEGAEDRLEIHLYPFSVARCGEEHLGTPAMSLHSLVYFYNWSFSHVRTRYALKWDADMILTDTAVSTLRDLAWQLEASDAVVKIPRFPLYVADDRRAFLDLGLANCEAWGWPNRPGYSFVKAMEWEQPVLPREVQRIVLPDWSCVELKYLDADEFDHWTDTDFHTTTRTRRKRREWEVFRALADGGEPPDEVVPVESPDGAHVIDYVRSVWLPQKEREPGALAERILRQLVRV
ncbi:MAG TPA: sulfotransferase family 2 domain-containing protein [Gaiellaceae bacterium]|nr:sulfotransferase family 2 domain-containing protein [Gaiellaceae bacterium]